jgi:hypothetical protein
MNGYEPTPRMSDHALQRCREMGISTKVAKAIVRHATLVYQSRAEHGESAWVATSKEYPLYAVPYAVHGNVKVILTVLYNGVEFTRPEAADRLR